MKEKFSNEYPKFQAKIANFVLSQNFTARCEEYDELFNQMSSIAPDDMRIYAQKSPAFLDARNKSLSIMEQIVSIHRDLKSLFELNEEAIGLAYNYDLPAVDKDIAEKLKHSAHLLHQYAIVSEAGRKAIEIADNPFLAQAL
jgi:hypothetical protein